MSIPAPSETFAVAKDASGSLATDEARLLLEAHQQLMLGETLEALRLLKEHERRFPASSMQQEREAVVIVANCAQGTLGEARKLWQVFAKRWLNSPFGARIRAACHWDPPP
jgi:outer membrane protein assembly factor BamD (BamD/ComL family)